MGTKKTQKKRRKIVKRVKNRLQLTQPTYSVEIVSREDFFRLFFGVFLIFFWRHHF